MAEIIVANLNARLMPMHRGEFFEDPLNDELEKVGLGFVSGGGTTLSAEKEVDSCDIEIETESSTEEVIALIVATLEALGAPKGSRLIVDAQDREVLFGQAEGLGVYLNGSDLPAEVYAQTDSNFVHAEFDRLTEGVGKVFSYWEGPRETAFYLYGTSFEDMKARLSPFLESYPLCQKCRVVQLC